MHIFGTPIPLRYINKTLSDWFRYALLKEDKAFSDAKFNFVYFSYQPDFEYLYISLSSLIENISEDYIGHVHLFEDQKAKFNEHELSKLYQLCPKLTIHPVSNFSWASPESTLAEIECFLKVSENANDSDMIVKVDSDILFLPSNKLVRLLKSGLHAVGDGHSEQYRFAQGGLYMLRSALVKSVLSKVELADILKISKLNRSVGEDKCISRVLKMNNKAFFLTRLMLFPTEYRKLNKLSAFNRWDFCAAHFVKDKESMRKFKNIFMGF